MENYLVRVRPPVHLRAELDIGYKIENQSVYIFEIRPQWNNRSIIRELPVAKATFVKAKNHWRVFWMRQNLKWYAYPPQPTVKKLEAFVRLVEEDDHHCFWG